MAPILCGVRVQPPLRVTGHLPLTAVSTGTVTLALGNAGANKWWGNNSGSTVAPSYQSIGTQDTSPNWYAAGGGTAQAQTVTLSPAPTALTPWPGCCLEARGSKYGGSPNPFH